MNKEKVQAALDDLTAKQDLFLISKLEEEYNELSDKCNKLYKFIYSLDFKEKVPDSNEQCLLQEQHKRMEAYRTNLYQRIEHYRIKVKIALGCDYFASWGDVAEKIHQKHHCGQDATCQVDDGNAVVDKPIITGESLEQLVGSTVRLFHKPGHKCEGCPYEVKSYGGKCEYKKVELVGGYYLCLASLPNSIVTE